MFAEPDERNRFGRLLWEERISLADAGVVDEDGGRVQCPPPPPDEDDDDDDSYEKYEH